MGIIDNLSYYDRQKGVIEPKLKIIQDYFNGSEGLNKESDVCDYGCNRGDMIKNLDCFYKFGYDNIEGVESDLINNFVFKKCDISEIGYFKNCNLALFLSVYHHWIAAYGVKKAKKIFYRILLSTDRLLFDVGNPSEIQSMQHPWYTELLKNNYFYEHYIFESFGLPYKKIGEWKCNGGKRSIVEFKKEDLIKKFEVLETLMPGKFKEHFILKKYEDSKDPHNIIYKLKLGDYVLCAKKRRLYNVSIGNSEELEEGNIKNVYSNSEKLKGLNLIDYWGRTKEYGLIFDWKDDLEFIDKVETKEEEEHNYIKKEFGLTDCDIFKDSQNKKYILDFER